MKIYSFWSADTTYFTKFKSLKKAREIGAENEKCYLETCEELGEQPTLTKDQFYPDEVEAVTNSWFSHLVKTNPDVMILDDELYALLK